MKTNSLFFKAQTVLHALGLPIKNFTTELQVNRIKEKKRILIFINMFFQQISVH